MKSKLFWAICVCVSMGLFGQANAQEKPGTPPVQGTSTPIKATNNPSSISEVAKLLMQNAAFLKATDKNATLTDKIKALEEKNVLKALELAKEWQSRRMFDSGTENLDDFKPIAQAFAIEAYVLLSEGRTLPAIDVTEQGLGIASLLIHQNMAGASVGLWCEDRVLAPLGRNLATVSLKEVDALARLAKVWLSDHEAATAAMLAGERTLTLSKIENAPELASLDATSRATAVQKAHTQTILFFERLQQNSQSPYPKWASERFGMGKPDVNATPLEKTVLSTQAQQMNALIAMVRRKAIGRLLATHAAIIRFRWENGKLPATLDELKLGTLAIDPFTESPLLYKPGGREYTLESAGEIVFDGSGKPDEMQRKHLRLVPSRKIEPK